MEVVGNVYIASDYFVGGKDKQRILYHRIALELEALSKVKILGNVARIATENQCITKGEYGVLSKKISDCQKLIGAWYKSDRLRLEDSLK